MPLQIRIRFDYQDELEKEPFVKETYEVLTFDSLAPVTADDAKTVSFGQWSSPSLFIGYHTSGKYYVKNVHPAKEDEWAYDGPRYGLYDMNPVAFFDSEWQDPFMVLYKFAPMTLGADDLHQEAEGLSKMSYEAIFKGFVDHRIRWVFDPPHSAGK